MSTIVTDLPDTYKLILAQPNGAPPILTERKLERPGPNQVTVKIDFAPINPSDIMTVQGIYLVPYEKPHPVGLEGAGTVVAVGEGLKENFKVGDKVHTMVLGSWGQYITGDSTNIFKVKEGLSQEQAASHLVNPGTVVAFANIMEQSGSKTAIHTAGASSLGRMLIRYFKHRGLKLINIVRRDEYVEELKRDGADWVLNSQSEGFEKELKELAKKEGAKVCFDAISGDLTGIVLNNMPEWSSVYVYGDMSDPKIKNVDAFNFMFLDKAIKGFWLKTHLDVISKEEGKKLLGEARSLLDGPLRSDVLKVFELEEFREAVELTEKGSSKGKVLFRPN